MSAHEYRRLVDPISVEVYTASAWHPGELRAWRRAEGVWRGFVGYNIGPGMNHVGWFDSDQLRQID